MDNDSGDDGTDDINSLCNNNSSLLQCAENNI